MAPTPDVGDVAADLRVSVGVLVRRLRQLQPEGELTLPESSALTRLDRGGPTTSSALAKVEQISAQSMGATLAGLERRGLVARTTDPEDGRRVVLSVTRAGADILRGRRTRRTQQIATALSRGGFDDEELRVLAAAAPLLERLAESL